MTTKELYINSIAVDISDELSIQYRSFLHGGLNTINAPRTWSVSLPLTGGLLTVLKGAAAADYSGDFPYKTWRVDYFEDSYAIINNGQAFLREIKGDKATFVFVWGRLLEVIKTLADKRLRDLTESSSTTLVWNRGINLSTAFSGMGFADFYSYQYAKQYVNADLPFAALHPFVSLAWLINRIGSEFDLDLGELEGLTDFNTIGFPLRTTEGVSTLDNKITRAPAVADIVGDTVTFESFAPLEIYKSGGVVRQTVLKPITQRIYGRINTTQGSGQQTLFLKYNGATVQSVLGVLTTELGSTFYGYTFDVTQELTAGEQIEFVFSTSVTVFDDLPSNVAIDVSSVTAVYGLTFPIIPNLPDMSCADFLIDCMQFEGVFPFVNDLDNDVLEAKSAKTLYDNVVNARDWSAKLVKTTTRSDRMEDGMFTMGDYGQLNFIGYAENKNNLGAADDVIPVDNDTLPKGGTIFRLKFQAARVVSPTNSTIFYPLYDIAIIGGDLERKATPPDGDVLCKLNVVGGVNTLQFPFEMTFSSKLTDENFVYFAKTIERPRMIKERLRLLPSEFFNMNMQIPVYLSQYGKYYAVILATKRGDISECELLELINI